MQLCVGHHALAGVGVIVKKPACFVSVVGLMDNHRGGVVSPWTRGDDLSLASKLVEVIAMARPNLRPSVAGVGETKLESKEGIRSVSFRDRERLATKLAQAV